MLRETLEMGDLNRAISMAAGLHAGQLDKQGHPYILHPLRVMITVQQRGGTLAQCIAAVLHDVVEDCYPDIPAGVREIRKAFGEEVAYMVDTLSRPKGMPYLDYIRSIGHNSPAMLIKLADIQDNLDPAGYREDLEPLYSRYQEARRILYQNDYTG